MQQPHMPFGAKKENDLCQLKLSLEKEGRPVCNGTAERQALASGLPRIKRELPQSKSASHPLYDPLRKKQNKPKHQQTRH